LIHEAKDSDGTRSISNQSNAVQIEIGTNVLSIDSSALSGCSNLTCVTIPNTTSKINCSAFRNDYNIKMLKIDAGVLYIEKNAFQSCSSLEHVIIPNTVKNIGNNAFQDCTSLKEVDATANINVVIGAYAFQNCVNLESFVMSDAEYDPAYYVDDCFIENGAFKNCTKLKTVHFSKYVRGYNTSVF